MKIPLYTVSSWMGRLSVGGRRIRILITGISAAGLLSLLAWHYVIKGDNDPVYKGKRLSEYLTDFDGIMIGAGGGISNGRFNYAGGPSFEFKGGRLSGAWEAVSEVGPDALPMLVRMLGAKDSKIALWIESKARRFPQLRPLVRTNRVSSYSQRSRALAAFSCLRSNATPALPRILQLLQSEETAMHAIVAVTYIQPVRESDILWLTNVFHLRKGYRSGPPEFLDAMAIEALGSFGPKASGAIPILIAFLSSTNIELGARAGAALARIGAPPKQVLPLMIAALPKANPPPSLLANRSRPAWASLRPLNILIQLWAIGQYGRHASNALPHLQRLQEYPMSSVKVMAHEIAD